MTFEEWDRKNDNLWYAWLQNPNEQTAKAFVIDIFGGYIVGFQNRAQLTTTISWAKGHGYSFAYEIAERAEQ